MWEDIIKKEPNKLQIMATAAEAYGGETFWLDKGLDIVFLKKIDRDSWSVDYDFNKGIKFRDEIDKITNEPRYWAFIAREFKDSSSRAPVQDPASPDIEIDLPEQGANYRKYLKRGYFKEENR
tara:strand:+ start:739 stop:1107 length:369 start_codon:yes stop_codon:yes gene_type:complete